MTTWQDAATDTGTQSVKLRRMSMAHKDKTGSSRGRARGRSASKKSAENPRLKSATGKLQPGPRKPKPRGRPEVRLSTHKSRSVWFQARASWPLRDAPVPRLVEARVRSLHAPQAALAGQWENVDHIVLYQKNIEAVCSSEAEVREQIRLTVIHELGHYFGLDENQLKDV